MVTNKQKGNKGEQLAQEYLKNNGFKILNVNWRYSNLGEIDIIAKKDDILIFVEVKARSGNSAGSPLEAVNQRKMSQLLRLAEIFLSKDDCPSFESVRFDIIGVILGSIPDITHFEDVYQF